jgi:signal transduction histidine kinase
MICLIQTKERISVIVHELAQPLQIMRVLVEQLTERPEIASPAAFERILSQVNGITAILGQAGNVIPVPHLQPTLLNPVIRESLELVCLARQQQKRSRPQAVQISLELADDAVLNIDKTQIVQVFTNLIRNAIEAMQTSGKHLRITTAHIETGIEIAVIDDGPGIDPSVADRLFEPFVTSKPTGTGIGLSVSLGVIKAHHGTLLVRDTTDNTTCFVVHLPK